MLLSMTTRWVAPRKMFISSSACAPETDDKVDHHIGNKALQFLSAATELVAIATDLLHAGGRSRRAAVKHRQCVSFLRQCAHGEPLDEAIPAN
jgi:hypothetical protein